jgi:hypothetical protein
MVDRAAEKVEGDTKGSTLLGLTQFDGVDLYLKAKLARAERSNMSEDVLPYSREKSKYYAQGHTGIGCVANGRGELEEQIPSFCVGVLVEVIIQETEDFGNLVGDSIVLLPKQKSVQCEMGHRDCRRVTEDSALILVEELPRFDLAILLYGQNGKQRVTK